MSAEKNSFGLEVGNRLRDIRRQQGLSLHAVQTVSGGEFKVSVLGAYERSERIISVLRLQRLAVLYGVPVDRLLPPPTAADLASHDTPESAGAAPGPPPDPTPVTIDLNKLKTLVAPEEDVLRRYISTIQIQRGDFNGRMISIRDEDVRSLARVLERDEASMRHRFDEIRPPGESLRVSS